MAPKNSRIPSGGGKFPAADYNTRVIERRHHTTGRQPGPQQVAPRDRRSEAEEILASPGAARAAAAAMEEPAPPRRGYQPTEGARKAAQTQRTPFNSAAARGTQAAMAAAKMSLTDEEGVETNEEQEAALNEIRLELTQRFVKDPEFTGGFVLAAIEAVVDLIKEGHLGALDAIKTCVKEIDQLAIALTRAGDPDDAEGIAGAIADWSNALVMINKLWTESNDRNYRLA